MVEDANYMDRALSLAELGRGRASPNPMVGALVVSPAGVIVGAGHHEEAGLAHAEIQALTEAGSGATGATLYCSLEPCCHTGRTGPCVERIVEAGITRVVVGVEDPNPLVNGGGIRYLRRHGVHVDVGVCRAEAARLNQAFFTLIGKHRPFVTLKVATSLDGRIAATSGRRTQLTSAPANRQVHLLRAEVDAIAVGSGTVLADDPLLTARGVHRSRPLTRVLFDTRLRTPPAARVLSTLDAGPVIIVTTEAGAQRGPRAGRGPEVGRGHAGRARGPGSQGCPGPARLAWDLVAAPRGGRHAASGGVGRRGGGSCSGVRGARDARSAGTPVAHGAPLFLGGVTRCADPILWPRRLDGGLCLRG